MLEKKKFLYPYFATVVVTIPVSSRGELTYRIPEVFRSCVSPGVRVVVSVNNRKTTGIVTETTSSLPDGVSTNLKDILDVLDEAPVFPRDMMRLWEWASNYYLTSLGEMLSTILPGGLRSEGARVVRFRQGKGTQSAKKDTANPAEAYPEMTLTQAEQEIVALVAAKKRIAVRTLQQHFPTLSIGRMLRKLESLDLLSVSEYVRRPKGTAPVQQEESESLSMRADKVFLDEEDPVSFSLSPAQTHASARIAEALGASAFQVFLLHGVTGSGKTEVYLQAAQAAVRREKSVLILVPEIALTHQLVRRVRHRFDGHVAVLHSALAARERWTEWNRIARGEVKVVVGVRSAVFVPIPRLGLVVVDEEHDTAYKQEEGVRYNARDIAVLRGKISSCPVILGSATPGLESHVHSRTQQYTLLTLAERVAFRPLPHVEIVDLRQERKAGNPDKILSAVLRQALIENQQTGKQSLLFLNRRGYANYLQCRLCGEALCCHRCSVTLTLHLQDGVLRCHYCGFSCRPPDRCPRCHEAALEGCGVGTEQVEDALNRLLPGVRIARLDRDSTRRRGTLARVLQAWQKHEIDVLIGTQMVAKGHDVPNVTLVGVLLADLSLNLPDFRAAERTFQLLTQVAGRAGRGKDAGRVIIQTYVPHHYSIRYAARHDFARFAAHELRYRKRLGYPPFTRMVNVRFEGRDREKVKARAEHFALAVQNAQPTGDQAPLSRPPTILGPAPAPLERLKGRERWHVLLRSANYRVLHALVQQAREETQGRSAAHGVRTIVDVDPYSVL